MTQTGLDQLVDDASAKNQQLDLTGILVFSQNYFFQVIEGEESKVLELKAKIEQDPRHQHVKVLSNSPCQQRLFPNWGMEMISCFDSLAELCSGDFNPYSFDEAQALAFAQSAKDWKIKRLQKG